MYMVLILQNEPHQILKFFHILHTRRNTKTDFFGHGEITLKESMKGKEQKQLLSK